MLYFSILKPLQQIFVIIENYFGVNISTKL